MGNLSRRAGGSCTTFQNACAYDRINTKTENKTRTQINKEEKVDAAEIVKTQFMFFSDAEIFTQKCRSKRQRTMYRDHCAIGGGLESVDEAVVHLDAANTTQHRSNKERNNLKKKRKKKSCDLLCSWA